MPQAVSGIHHITAIAGDPQANLNFYAGVLGLRFVKRTVNFDDPGTYHFYYGDEAGMPGTILTFFPWGAHGVRGRRGLGQATTVSFSVPRGSLPFWQERLTALGIRYREPTVRFGERVLSTADPDGIPLELVATEDDRPGYATAEIPPEAAIRGLHSALLAEEGFDQTAALLEDALGLRRVAEEDGRVRFGAEAPAGFVDLVCLPTAQRGTTGTGAIHHLAFRVPDDSAQEALRESLRAEGVNVTPALDRQYFRSVYFREPGGVLFEIATDTPGFLWDEDKRELGKTLKLPPWYEEQRGGLERVLPEISVPKPYTQEKRI
jgi:catechol 2,3-dioxygenase-like lactoylglutathione lyase family enzyme